MRAFLGVLTHPLEQDLQESLKAAAVSVSLVGLCGGVAAGESRHAIADIGGPSLVLVLLWMVGAAVFPKPERRKLAIARSLSVVAFWIAVTMVFVLAAEALIPDSLDRAMRFVAVLFALVISVPVHMFRSLTFRVALGMTFPLLVSMGILARMLLY